MYTYHHAIHPASRHTTNEPASVPPPPSASPLVHVHWQQQAISAYRHAAPHDHAALQHDLAARIASLTARQIPPATIYADPSTQRAIVALDGVVFRLERHDLAILRPCVTCGTVQIASPPIATQAELGHALAAWQPCCAHCTPADAADWLE
jgi:hypothetical protein